MMKFLWKFLPILLGFMTSSCCIHLWPDEEDEPKPIETYPLTLHLHFNPDVYVWQHSYDKDTQKVTQSYPDSAVIPNQPGTTEVYDNTLPAGKIKHIVRIYKEDNDINYLKELISETGINAGYDCEMTLELPVGNYKVVAWSDPVEPGETYFHNAQNFLSVNLNDFKHANAESQDAFSGILPISISGSLEEQYYVVEMTRPYSKYEFIATDLQDFIDKENTRRSRNGEEPISDNDITDYRILLTYPGFMPYSYSVIDDRLVDSMSGVAYESKVTQINDHEVSLGFDYVMINAVKNVGDSQQVTVKITVYAPDGEQVANSAQIQVPLRRDNHTVIRSNFLSENSQGGVAIDPSYDGDHNINM